MNLKTFQFAAAAIASAMVSSAALGGAHTWRFNEVFSNPSGTIQFIEIREAFGGPGEVFLGGLTVRGVANNTVFTFPSNLSGNTANRTILLATASFAALPGVPTPDHIIPANFFNPNGDTLRYNNGVYDQWVFGAGAVPTDMCMSLQRNWGSTPGPGLNSPRNYANVEGHYADDCKTEPPSCSGDIAPGAGDGTVNVDDLVVLLGAWGKNDGPADLNSDGQVNVDDLVTLLGSWGDCPK